MEEPTEQTRPLVNKKHLLYTFTALLGLYALVITVYVGSQQAGLITSDAPPTRTAIAPAIAPADDAQVVSVGTGTGTSHSHSHSDSDEKKTVDKESDKENQGEGDSKAKSGLHNQLLGSLEEAMGGALPEEDLKTFRTGFKVAKAAMSPQAVAMNAVTSLVVTALSMAIVVGLAYLSYRSAELDPPLFPKPAVQVVQNYARLVGVVSAGGLLLSSALVWLDSEGRVKTGGIAHVSAVFFACIGVLCMFLVTFSEMTLNAQTMHLPELGEGFLSGHTAQTLMSWLTVFLQYNLRILASGLMIMWLAQFAVRWVLEQAKGTRVHHVCSVLALPVTIAYMSAKKSGSLMGSIFGVAITILTFALTIDLISPD